MFGIDSKGYPIVYPDRVDLGITIVPTKTGGGNPSHDSFSGKFSFLPGGVVAIRGEDLLKGLSSPQRKVLFQRAQISKANQVAARIINGKLYIVLLSNGRRIDSFSLSNPADSAQTGTPQTPPGGAGAPAIGSPVVRDALVDAARGGLEGKQLTQFLEKRGIQIPPGGMAQFMQLIDEQRKNDLVDYLDQQLRKQTHQSDQIDRVRISVGRGYLRQVFSRYKPDEIKVILQRLEGRGWSEDVIHSNVISKLPKRLRDPLQSSVRQVAGNAEVQNIKQQQNVQPTPKQTIPTN